MTRLILAIDQGTTSSRALVIDAHGLPRGMGRRPVAGRYPRPGWVEQDAAELWRATLAAARDALAAAGARPGDLAAVGIANQTETSVLWERRSGAPVRPAIGWQSRQTVPVVDDLARRGLTEVYQTATGLVPDACFSATKLAWWLDGDPALRRRAEAGELCFGTVDAWLLWNLSGGRLHVTDASNASRTMLFDLRALAWSDELLGYLAIPRALLPPVRGSAEVLGETDGDLLGAAVPLAGVAGDQQAALFGHRCFRPGEAKCTYGTGSFVLMQIGPEPKPSRHRLLTTVAWSLGGRVDFALEGGAWTAGAAVAWLRDAGIVRSVAEVEELAASVADSGGAVVVPAFAGLGAPHWDPTARGTILGLTLGTTQAHIARATLEAIALQVCDVLSAMIEDAGASLAELRVDGGVAGSDLLLQLQSDLLGIPVVRPALSEATALGAADLAGLATGVWADRAELPDRRAGERRFEPRRAHGGRDRLLATWRRAVQRARAWDT
jgi:glycerol kinase